MSYRVKLDAFCDGCGGILLSAETTLLKCESVAMGFSDRFKDRRKPKWMSDGDWEKLGRGPVIGMATSEGRWRQTKHFCSVCADEGPHPLAKKAKLSIKRKVTR